MLLQFLALILFIVIPHSPESQLNQGLSSLCLFQKTDFWLCCFSLLQFYFLLTSTHIYCLLIFRESILVFASNFLHECLVQFAFLLS